MIALIKQNSPEILRENAANWRDKLCSTINSGNTPTQAQKTRYNHEDIKAALVTETSGKCAYCESKIRHIDDGDIEHIVPKSVIPEKTFDWENLTIACTVCNRNKGTYYGEPGTSKELINPYQDDPAAHFLFYKEILSPTPESLRAHHTENEIDLNRSDLIEKRREKVQELHQLITAYAQAEDQYRHLVLTQIKKQYLGFDKEYSAFTKSYINQMVERGTLQAKILN